MSKLDQLKSCESLSDLATIMGLKPQHLGYVIHAIPDASKYEKFYIPKKNGERRLICSPKPNLSLIQSRLLDLLSDCEAEINPVFENTNKNVSHGFRRKNGTHTIPLSIRTNARKHVGKRYVLNIDIDDYFPSFNFGRVRGYFLKNNYFKLNEPVATAIAQICCFENQLPQGAPTSPVVSNLICGILDQRLIKIAKKYGCSYSRYADDITFSTNQYSFPIEIASFERGWFVRKVLGILGKKNDKICASQKLVGVFSQSGFSINKSKTRLQENDLRQVVTGLVVNRKPNVSREYKKRTRSMIHSLVTTGSATHAQPRGGSGPAIPVSLEQILGRTSHAFFVEGGCENMKPWSKLANNNERIPTLYKDARKLLMYKNFHVNERPLIICEGPTDSIYLKCALNSLATNFPELIAAPTTQVSKWTRQIDFYNHGSRLNRLVMELSGGVYELEKLIQRYEKETSKFHSGGQCSPVIIIVDNDKAAKRIWSAVERVAGLTNPVDGSGQFYHVVGNLFVVPIQKIGGNDTSIEDLFEESVLNTQLGDKNFGRKKSNSKLGENEYSKMYFAKYVVARQQATIDFSNFRPVLETIRTVAAQNLKPSGSPDSNGV